jgi:hypothetical protein
MNEPLLAGHLRRVFGEFGHHVPDQLGDLLGGMRHRTIERAVGRRFDVGADVGIGRRGVTARMRNIKCARNVRFRFL